MKYEEWIDKFARSCLWFTTVFLIPIVFSVPLGFVFVRFVNWFLEALFGPPRNPNASFIISALATIYYVVKMIQVWYKNLFWAGFRDFTKSGTQELPFDSSQNAPSIEKHNSI